VCALVKHLQLFFLHFGPFFYKFCPSPELLHFIVVIKAVVINNALHLSVLCSDNRQARISCLLRLLRVSDLPLLLQIIPNLLMVLGHIVCRRSFVQAWTEHPYGLRCIEEFLWLYFTITFGVDSRTRTPIDLSHVQPPWLVTLYVLQRLFHF